MNTDQTSTKTLASRSKPVLIGVGILAVGAIGLALMMVLRPEPQKVSVPNLAPVVQTITVKSEKGDIQIEGDGIVER